MLFATYKNDTFKIINPTAVIKDQLPLNRLKSLHLLLQAKDFEITFPRNKWISLLPLLTSCMTILSVSTLY